MVDKIILNPTKVRGYGNIVKEHTVDDYSIFHSVLSKTSETINGVNTKVYKLVYSLLGFVFSFDEGNKQLYIQAEYDDTLELDFDSVNKQLYVMNYSNETVNFAFDSLNKQLYISAGD